MQLKDGTFCDRVADLRFPNRICAHHAIKVYLATKNYLDDMDLTQVASLVGADADS